MEYEIYYLCNVLGLIVIFLVILFHFIDADNENSKSYEKENGEVNNEKPEVPVNTKKNEKIRGKH